MSEYLFNCTAHTHNIVYIVIFVAANRQIPFIYTIADCLFMVSTLFGPTSFLIIW